jgi:hypothetical protein
MAKEKRYEAFTLIELLVIIGVLVILFAAFIAPSTSTYRRNIPQRNACANNLRNIGLAFKTWMVDYSNQIPARVSAAPGESQRHTGEAFRHFQVMSNELGSPRVVLCPADTRLPANDFGSSLSNSNVSYFVALDVVDDQPQMLLAGDRNITNGLPPRNGILTLATNSVVGWAHELHKDSGQVLLADGSVQRTSTPLLRQILRNSGGTNRLAIP